VNSSITIPTDYYDLESDRVRVYWKFDCELCVVNDGQGMKITGL